jgi:hypothetical protein
VTGHGSIDSSRRVKPDVGDDAVDAAAGAEKAGAAGLAGFAVAVLVGLGFLARVAGELVVDGVVAFGWAPVRG